MSSNATRRPEGGPRRGPQRLVIFTDGASRGNPGEASVGVVITDGEGHTLERVGLAIGRQTNNVAEYTALITALERARRYRVQEVEVRSDSLLLVNQLIGQYRVRHAGLIGLHRRALVLAKGWPRITFRHIPRESNVEADAMANEALDRVERFEREDRGDMIEGVPRAEKAGKADRANTRTAGPNVREGTGVGQVIAGAPLGVPEESPRSTGQGAG